MAPSAARVNMSIASATDHGCSISVMSGENEEVVRPRKTDGILCLVPHRWWKRLFDIDDELPGGLRGFWVSTP